MSSPFGTLVLIADPRSGRGRIGQELPEIERQLQSKKLAYRLVETESPGQATQSARAALESGERFLVAVGGDETVHDVVNGMIADDRAFADDSVLGFIPAGSECDFVRTFGLPGDVVRAVRHLGDDQTYSIDIGKVSFQGDEDMKRFLAALCTVAAAFLVAIVALPAGGKQQPRKTIASVRAADLGDTIEVLGKLDQPLGRLLTVRGEMVEADFGKREKGVDPEEYVRVRQVGDRTLDEPAIIWLGDSWAGKTVPKPGTALALIGYETGAFRGLPPAELEWANKRDSGVRADREFHFSLTFEVLEYQERPGK